MTIASHEDASDGRALGSIQSILAVAITSFIGVNATYFAPIEIGAFIDRFGLSATAGGTIVTVELSCIALTSLIAGGWLSRTDMYRVALWASVLTVLANLACALPINNVLIYGVLRALAGIGGGLAFAISCIWTARSAQPARVYGIGVVLISLVAAAAMLPLSTVAEQSGLQGVFLIIGALLVVALVLLLFVRPVQHIPDNAEVQGTTASRTRLTHIGLFAAVILSNLALSIIWQFAERLGREYGFEPAAIGSVLSFSALAGISGSAIAAVVSNRWGHGRALIAGMALGCFCGLLISAQSGFAGYAISIALSQVAFLFIMPFLIGVGAWLDPFGKLAATVGGVALTASAISPIAGGLIVDLLSAQASGWACAIFSLLAILAIIPIAIDEQKQRRATNA